MRRLLWSVLWSVGDWCHRKAFDLYDGDEVRRNPWSHIRRVPDSWIRKV